MYSFGHHSELRLEHKNLPTGITHEEEQLFLIIVAVQTEKIDQTFGHKLRRPTTIALQASRGFHL